MDVIYCSCDNKAVTAWTLPGYKIYDPMQSRYNSPFPPKYSQQTPHDGELWGVCCEFKVQCSGQGGLCGINPQFFSKITLHNHRPLSAHYYVVSLTTSLKKKKNSRSWGLRGPKTMISAWTLKACSKYLSILYGILTAASYFNILSFHQKGYLNIYQIISWFNINFINDRSLNWHCQAKHAFFF